MRGLETAPEQEARVERGILETDEEIVGGGAAFADQRVNIDQNADHGHAQADGQDVTMIPPGTKQAWGTLGCPCGHR